MDRIHKLYAFIIKKPFLSLLLLLIFASIPIFIIGIFYNCIDVLKLGYIFKPFKAAEILSYIGTIISIFIGAIATFGVLYITIQFEKDERKKERRLQIYPYFRYEIVKQPYNNVVDLYKNIDLTQSDDKSHGNMLEKSLTFGLNIENIGLRSAINYTILEINALGERDISVQGLGDINIDEIKFLEFIIFSNSKENLNNNLIKDDPINIKIAYNNITGDYYEQNIKILFTLDTMYLNGKESDYKPIIIKNGISKPKFYSDKNIDDEESKKMQSFFKKDN